MDWQLVASLVIVGIAAFSLTWRGWRSWRSDRNGDCAGGCCGKSKAPAQQPALIPPEQLILRR